VTKEILSFDESCERTLLASKIWLVNHLPKNQYNRVYVLGSWYGNMGLIMDFMDIKIKQLINVDINKLYCRNNETIYKLANVNFSYKILNRNCNDLKFNHADLIINTSTNDIKTRNWFDHIPHGCTVAIQCRNNQDPEFQMDRPDTLREFLKWYKLSKTLYTGAFKLNEDDEHYSRYMKIGIK